MTLKNELATASPAHRAGHKVGGAYHDEIDRCGRLTEQTTRISGTRNSSAATKFRYVYIKVPGGLANECAVQEMCRYTQLWLVEEGR